MILSDKETHQDIKYKNKKLILNCIQHSSPISRAEISQKLKLSKPTVSYIVEELISDNWVSESRANTYYKKTGKKPIYLNFNNQAGYIVGVDIGGTKVLIAISDLSGEIIASKTFETGDYLKSGLLEKIKLTVKELITHFNIKESKILGMGIGVPGVTDVSAGCVVDAPSLGWTDFHLKDKIQQLFDIPVYIDNDVNVSVLGEQWLGAAQDNSNVLLISIGTGIGSGILLNGSLFRGSTWAAGEIGYMVTEKNEAKNRKIAPFKGYGFLDAHVGGAAIKQRMIQELSENPQHQLYSKGNSFTTKDVFNLAINNDELALRIVTESIEHLSFAIVNAVVLFNPEIVILGGGISKSGHWFLDKVKETVNSYVPSDTKIELTCLGDKMGVIGAISLFLREHESVLKT